MRSTLSKVIKRAVQVSVGVFGLLMAAFFISVPRSEWTVDPSFRADLARANQKLPPDTTLARLRQEQQQRSLAAKQHSIEQQSAASGLEMTEKLRRLDAIGNPFANLDGVDEKTLQRLLRICNVPPNTLWEMFTLADQYRAKLNRPALGHARWLRLLDMGFPDELDSYNCSDALLTQLRLQGR